MRLALPILALAVALGAAACGSGSKPIAVPGGDAENGARLIESYGCGACHRIGGIPRADGRVGPSLHHFSGDRFLAGRLGNTPRNAIRWIMHPQRIAPGTLMPDLGVTPREARDIVPYLFAH